MNGIVLERAVFFSGQVLKVSRPIMSAGKLVRLGRKTVLDVHNSHIEDKE